MNHRREGMYVKSFMHDKGGIWQFPLYRRIYLTEKGVFGYSEH